LGFGLRVSGFGIRVSGLDRGLVALLREGRVARLRVVGAHVKQLELRLQRRAYLRLGSVVCCLCFFVLRFVEYGL